MSYNGDVFGRNELFVQCLQTFSPHKSTNYMYVSLQVSRESMRICRAQVRSRECRQNNQHIKDDFSVMIEHIKLKMNFNILA